MKVALDTNILAYAEGANGSVMRDKALALLQRLPFDGVVLPVQTASAEAQCPLLLSEDLQEGFTWRGVTAVNRSRRDFTPCSRRS